MSLKSAFILVRLYHWHQVPYIAPYEYHVPVCVLARELNRVLPTSINSITVLVHQIRSTYLQCGWVLPLLLQLTMNPFTTGNIIQHYESQSITVGYHDVGAGSPINILITDRIS